MFGNYLLPQTLSLNFGDAHLVYTTKPPSTPFDQFMHIVKCKSDNLRIMLVPSPKYSGKIDEYVIYTIFTTLHYVCLQCFDAVGWVAGRASGL